MAFVFFVDFLSNFSKEVKQVSIDAIKDLKTAKEKFLSSKLASDKFKDALAKFKNETTDKINQNAQAFQLSAFRSLDFAGSLQ